MIPDDDTPEDKPEFSNFVIDFHSLGTAMTERESFERIVEGLKSAADGARHLAFLFEDDRIDYLAENFDRMRKLCVETAGAYSPAAVEPTQIVRQSNILSTVALDRLLSGLRQAEGAAFQMATGHRGDAAWSKFAEAMRTFQDKAKLFVRIRAQRTGMTSAGIILPN